MPFNLDYDYYVCVCEWDTTPAHQARFKKCEPRPPEGPLVWEHYLSESGNSLEAMRAKAKQLSATGYGEVKVAKLQFIDEEGD